jgi:hypothetical protein
MIVISLNFAAALAAWPSLNTQQVSVVCPCHQVSLSHVSGLANSTDLTAAAAADGAAFYQQRRWLAPMFPFTSNYASV